MVLFLNFQDISLIYPQTLIFIIEKSSGMTRRTTKRRTTFFFYFHYGTNSSLRLAGRWEKSAAFAVVDLFLTAAISTRPISASPSLPRCNFAGRNSAWYSKPLLMQAVDT